MSVQKQAGQWTRYKAFVDNGDYNGHIGLGVKCSKEVTTAIRGATISVKLSIVPGRTRLKLLLLAGIDDCYTPARGCTATLDNFAKASFDAVSKTYSYLTPKISAERLCSPSLTWNALTIL
ncbi:hypothetical protein U0070_024019 [Myodes glareolus]|uniref:Small ribosomal subunit protein uS5 n=1 Tax=Myodes glareolus TaxID=447135 RepID=A0AAW0I0K7_MYOGA